MSTVPAAGSGGEPLARTHTRELQGSRGSRDTSPTRRTASPATGTAPSRVPSYKARRPKTTRSARSSREPSPARPALAKALQSQTQHPSAPDLQQARSQRNAPTWSNSARLTLPKAPSPESRSSPLPSPKKKTEAPNQPTNPSIVLVREGGDCVEEPDLPSGMRTPRSNPSSAGLRTVVEGNLPNTPAIGPSKVLVEHVAALAAQEPSNAPEDAENEKTAENKSVRQARTASIASSIATTSQQESESESGYKSEDKPVTAPTKQMPPPSKSLARRQTVVGKDMSSRSMTVETETVSSVPQVALAALGPQGGGSIRSKKSTDTIRAPRKDKKKTAKRNTAGSSAQPSSKADIFAAKIAEAVDEANSSDSDETFVYESNPPEPAQRPTSRFHSRTPSATSIQGGPDPRAQRLPLFSTLEGTQSTGRKGMKFVNNSLNKEMISPGMLGDGMDNERGGGGSSREAHRGFKDRNGNSRHHNGHRSILSDDPFHRQTLHKSSTHSLRHVADSQSSSRHPSLPSSPRHAAFRNGVNGYGAKKSPRSWAPYEADEEGADDEQLPLISTSRGSRGYRRSRPGNGSLRQLEHNQARRRSWIKNYAGCIVAVVTMILIMVGVGGFLIATTNALQDVRVVDIKDVLVSKQEIMLDLVVEAVNPNVITVNIGSMDVNLFAKSRHVREGGEGDGGKGSDDDRDDDDDDDGWLSVRAISQSDTKRALLDHPEGDGSSRGKEERLGPASMDFKKAIQERLSAAPFSRPRYRISDNVDEGTDPIPEPDKETMLLGRIFSFDSFLVFDGSPFRHEHSSSTGELRLAKPGNKTEEGGTERWERVLQHPFELIVRGVLKYQLPLSGKTRTAPISASTIVHPDIDDVPADVEVPEKVEL